MGGEPNNAGEEDCLGINSENEKWYDISCSYKFPFICEVNQEVTTVKGNHSFTFNSLNVSDSTFTLWWKNNPKVKRSNNPGSRFSWHIKGGSTPAPVHMEAYVRGS